MFELDLKQIFQVVRDAGNIALKIANEGFRTEKKQDGSPVTRADREVNDYLLKKLSDLYPRDEFVLEESGKSGNKNEYERIWFIDPIDGTSDFIKGIPEWAIQIGVCREDHPFFGIVYQPNKDKLFYGLKGEGAFLISDQKKSPLKVRDLDIDDEICLVHSRSHLDPRAEAFYTQLNIGKKYPHGSVGLKVAEISLGNADLYINASGKCKFWDTCGPEVILSEAGGELRLANGDKINYKNSEVSILNYFIAGPPKVVDYLIKAYNSGNLTHPS